MSQDRAGPERYGASIRFETIPKPKLAGRLKYLLAVAFGVLDVLNPFPASTKQFA
ncbi:MAG: hypothetical protein WBW27_24480 [Pseudolabrys sp.]